MNISKAGEVRSPLAGYGPGTLHTHHTECTATQAVPVPSLGV
jgi:hypothetical protein